MLKKSIHGLQSRVFFNTLLFLSLLLLGASHGFAQTRLEEINPSLLSPEARLLYERNRAMYAEYKTLVEQSQKIPIERLSESLDGLLATMKRGPSSTSLAADGVREAKRAFEGAASQVRDGLSSSRDFPVSRSFLREPEPPGGSDPTLRLLHENFSAIRKDILHKKDIARLALRVLDRLQEDARSAVREGIPEGIGAAGREDPTYGLRLTTSLLQAHVAEIQTLELAGCGP